MGNGNSKDRDRLEAWKGCLTFRVRVGSFRIARHRDEHQVSKDEEEMGGFTGTGYVVIVRDTIEYFDMIQCG